jgi:hypothetical protein
VVDSVDLKLNGCLYLTTLIETYRVADVGTFDECLTH